MQNKINEHHKKYLERIAFYKSFGYDIEKERRFIFEKAEPISGNILEIGTGKGHFALELAREGHMFTSIDVSEEEQEFARLNIEQAGFSKQVHFKIEDAEHLNFKDASIDIIFSINTMHHLTNPFKVMDELIRIISSKGKIILSDFNKEGFKIMNKVHESEGRKHEANTITLGDIKDYLKNKDFITEEYSSQFQDVLVAFKK